MKISATVTIFLSIIFVFEWSIGVAFVSRRLRARPAPLLSRRTSRRNPLLQDRTAFLQEYTSCCWLSQTSSSNSEADDAFMTALRTRMDKTNRTPLVVLDSMLPRQELNITIRNPTLLQLIQNRIENESPVFCMLGMARLATGQLVHLKYGVQVEILQCLITPARRVSVHLKAGNLLRVKDETVAKSPHGDWTEAQVEVLNPIEAEKAINSIHLAQAMWKARQLDHLVQEWIPLAKTKERIPNQVEKILDRLGDMPLAEQPTDRAFWVGALINPIPALGVAMEIRPALLLAKTPNERVDIVITGIRQSIERLKQQQDTSSR